MEKRSDTGNLSQTIKELNMSLRDKYKIKNVIGQ